MIGEELVCFQCPDLTLHLKSQHGKHGCKVEGCGCRVVNLDD